MAPRLLIDEDYEETVHLADGTPVIVRLVRPSDKELIRKGFEHLSPESRYKRFFAWKRELTDEELKYFTEMNGHDHLAIGAARILPNGEEEGLGIARFVRVPDEPECAEAAVAVVDDWQGHGLGHVLLERLIIAARERGIRRFRAEVLLDNAAVRALLQEGGDLVHETPRDAGVVAVDALLPDLSVPTTEARSLMHRLLAAAAAGIAKVHPSELLRRFAI